MDYKRVVVTGVGVLTPIGNKKDEFWQALCDGKTGITRITSFDPSNFDSQIAGEVKNFDPSKYLSVKEVKRTEKFVQFAVTTSKEAVEDAGLNLEQEDRCRIGWMLPYS